MVEQNKIRDAVDAVRGLAEVVPIYQDSIQPAAQELGKTLKLPVKAVNALLKPLEKLIWRWEQIWEYTQDSLAEKIKDVPEEHLVTPDPIIAVPTFEALRYTGGNQTLRELYTNLLATSMDARTVQEAHPAFVEIIRQLTPDEALILKLFISTKAYPLISLRANDKDTKIGGITVLRHFGLLSRQANCSYPNLLSNYLDNLSRLGLLAIQHDSYLTAPNTYDPLEQNPEVLELIEVIKNEERLPEINKQFVELTDLGHQFIKACVE